MQLLYLKEDSEPHSDVSILPLYKAVSNLFPFMDQNSPASMLLGKPRPTT